MDGNISWIGQLIQGMEVWDMAMSAHGLVLAQAKVESLVSWQVHVHVYPEHATCLCAELCMLD